MALAWGQAAEVVTSPVGLFLGSSQGSASACRASEAGPAGSARSSSGVIQAWSAKVSPGSVSAPPAPFGDELVTGHAITPCCAGTPLPGAVPPVTPASAHTSLGNEGRRHGRIRPRGFGASRDRRPGRSPTWHLTGLFYFLSDPYLETNLSV